jgi:hypothetical protein
MATHDQPRNGWTIVLRCQPARIVKGQAEGGYTDAYEIICCDCGDHPGLDYREVHRGFSWSAGQPDRGRRCRIPTTSSCTSSQGGATGRG